MMPPCGTRSNSLTSKSNNFVLISPRETEQLRSDLAQEIKRLDAKIEQLRSDLMRETKQLDLKIERLGSDLTRDMKDLEYRMIIKLGAMLVVAVGAMAALVKILSIRDSMPCGYPFFSDILSFALN